MPDYRNNNNNNNNIRTLRNSVIGHITIRVIKVMLVCIVSGPTNLVDMIFHLSMTFSGDNCGTLSIVACGPSKEDGQQNV